MRMDMHAVPVGILHEDITQLLFVLWIAVDAAEEV